MKEPQRDTTKRPRSTKQKQESFDTANSEKGRVETNRGADRPSVGGQSTQPVPPEEVKPSPAKPIPRTAPQAETQSSAAKSASSQEGRKSDRAGRAMPEVVTAERSRRYDNHERIAQRAYALYEASGYTGDAIQHWLEAERELRNRSDESEHDKP